jgi:histidinol-phosphatase
MSSPVCLPSISNELLADLTIAHQLADLADVLTSEKFQTLGLKIETKPDLTPVTEVDRGVERILRDHLLSALPDDAVIGEEFPNTGNSNRSWVIDPIDGTKNYVRGVPVWATLIALLIDGEPVIGVVSAPALNRRWWAAKSGGAFVGSVDHSGFIGKQIKVSKVTNLSDASLSISDLGTDPTSKYAAGFGALTNQVWRTRGYGDFWQHCLVAEGAIDLAAEPQVALWDLAPLAIIVEEAGGRFSGLNAVRGPDQGTALSSNGALHEAALKAINA